MKDLIIQTLITIFAAVTISFGLFEFWVKKRIEYRITALFSRVSKIHEMEFSVIPESWRKLQEAHGHAYDMTSYMQREPNFKTWDQEDFEVFVETLPWHGKHKQKLLNQTDCEGRIEYFKKKDFWYRFNEAKMHMNAFHNYIRNNKIFLQDELHDKFNEMDGIIYKALSTRELDEQLQDLKATVAVFEELNTSAEAILPEIERLVKARLRYFEA